MLVLKGAEGDTLSIFIPIYKVDEEKRLVYGKMTEEKPDTSDEIWDYEGSKPYFSAWSENAQKTSGGKSLGNLRSMHQPIAAGKLTQFVLNDEDKGVDIAAKVVDDAEWTKVLEGVYTGFSQGGKYVKRWKDPDDPTKTRFISDPVEVSLVDIPCLPTATFEVIRAGGAVEIRKFKTEAEAVEPTNEQVAARAIEMAKAADKGSEWATFVADARAALVEEMTKAKADPEGNGDASDENSGGDEQEDGDGKKAKPTDEDDKGDEGDEDETGKAAGAKKPGDKESEDNQPDGDTPADREKAEGNGAETPDPDQPAAAPEESDGQSKKPKDKKAARDSLVQVWQTPDKIYFAKAADAVDYLMGTTSLTPVEQALAKAKGDSKKPYGDVEYADPKNGKYPIDTEEHIRAAWSYINQEKNAKEYSASELKSVKDKIIAAWKKHIDEDGPPSADKMALFGDVVKTIALLQAVQATRVEKGIYTISSTANVLQSMAYIAQSVAREAAAEGDASDQPSQARDILAALSTFLVDMAEEETTELLASLDSFDPSTSAYCVPYGEWAKSTVDLLKTEMATPEWVEKRGARNSSKDAATIQKMHDHATELGAKCQMANVAEDEHKAAEPEDLEKRAETDPVIKALLEEREALRTEVTKAVAGIEELGGTITELRGQVEKLSKEPTPLPPNAHVMEKGGGGAGPADPTAPLTMIAELSKTSEGQRMLAEAAIRLSQQNGHRA